MAKVKESKFLSWKEVDEALGRIRENTITIRRAESAMNNQITMVKGAFSEKVEPLQAENAELEKEIEAYTKAHISEFTDRKTKEMTYGKVGFRKVSEIVTRNVKAIMEACKQHDMFDCIKVSEKLDKEALEKYSDKALETVGAHRKEAEKYFYDIDLEELE